MDLIPIEPHWAWMILAAVLGGAEIIVPGFFLIWIAAAALLTGLTTLLVGIDAPIQFAEFAALAVASVFAGRRWFAFDPNASADPLLNHRALRLYGETVTVVEAIVGGEGRVKVGDGVWPAKGADAPVGARLRVAGFENGRLLVEQLPS